MTLNYDFISKTNQPIFVKLLIICSHDVPVDQLIHSLTNASWISDNMQSIHVII